MAGKMTPLESGLIVRKGHAAPASQRESVPEHGLLPVKLTQSMPQPIGRARRSGTIAITVRLDPDRYERLKALGVNQGLTNQEIMVAALDAWFLTQSQA
jgi:hypothetical protein